jgi:hypothetical protein
MIESLSAWKLARESLKAMTVLVCLVAVKAAAVFAVNVRRVRTVSMAEGVSDVVD